MPPAIAGPSTAAMSGLVSRKPLSSGLMYVGSNSPDSNRSVGAEDDIDFRSAPAQKYPPAPVRITTRTSGSELARSQASPMIAIISAGQRVAGLGTVHRDDEGAALELDQAVGGVGGLWHDGSVVKNENVF